MDCIRAYDWKYVAQTHTNVGRSRWEAIQRRVTEPQDAIRRTLTSPDTVTKALKLMLKDKGIQGQNWAKLWEGSEREIQTTTITTLARNRRERITHANTYIYIYPLVVLETCLGLLDIFGVWGQTTLKLTPKTVNTTMCRNVRGAMLGHYRIKF